MTRKYLSVAGLAALAWASLHVPALAQTATEAAAEAAPAEIMDKGDAAWMMTATLLVLCLQ